MSWTWRNKRCTENARRGRASLRLRTDVSLLASLYSDRAKPAGAPFSLSLFVYLSLLLLSLLPVRHSPPSALPPSYIYIMLSLSFSSVPPSSPPTISPTLTFQLRVPALPRSHSIHFSSPPPPTVHRFNHEYLFLFRISFHSNLPSRFLRPPSVILCLSLSRHSLFFSHFRVLSVSCSVPLIVVSFLLLYPTRPAFLSLDLRPSR